MKACKIVKVFGLCTGCDCKPPCAACKSVIAIMDEKPKEKSFTRKQIAAMTIEDYCENLDDIVAAMHGGRISP